MHRSQHAGDEFIYAIAFLHQWHQRRYPTFIIRSRSEMREDKFLERVDLVLEGHEIGDCLVAAALSGSSTRQPG